MGKSGLNKDPGGDRPQGAAASLLNGLSVLEAFSRSTHTLLGVTEISDTVGLHKSTVSRMLTGLTEAGFIQRDEESGRYRLGLGVIGLAGPLLADLDVRRAALPLLEAMTLETLETSAISVWNGTNAVVVEQVASPHQVKHSASIGTRYNKFASSSVRVFLSEFTDTEVDHLISSGAIQREGYLGLEDPIHAQLKEVRHEGIALNDGETTFEEFGVSAPVRDYRGKVVGCITASAPRSRVQYRRSQAELVQAVRHTASAVTVELGAKPADDR